MPDSKQIFMLTSFLVLLLNTVLSQGINKDKNEWIKIDIEIDKLTNSIENSISGDVFDTELILFKKTDRSYIKAN